MSPALVPRCWNLIKQVTVEPIVFLSFLSIQAYQLVQQVGVYQVVCQKTYATRPEIDCSHLANVTVDGVPAENTVQEQMATFHMALSLAYMIPGLVADIFLGACGDRYGRKVNMLLGMVGLVISQYPLVVLFAFPLSTPLYLLVLANVITGFTGYISITMVSAFAYLADTIADPEQVTIHMAITTVVMNAAMIIGPLMASAVAETLTGAQGVLLCQALLTAAFLICLLRVRQVPPAQIRRTLQQKGDKEGGQPASGATSSEKETRIPVQNRGGKGESEEPFWSLPLNLLKETWHTFTKPRPGHTRLYLLVSVIAFFLSTISDGAAMTVGTLYLQKAPLSWSQETIGYYRSGQSVLLFVGTGIGVLIFKKLFHFTDTFLIFIAGVSNAAQFAIMAFATTTWMVWAASVAGSLSMLISPCIQSFLAQLVGPDEVGKAYTAFGISFNIGFLVSSAVYSPIYSATLTFFAGFVYLFAASLQGLSSLGTLWMHIDVHTKSQPANVGFWKKLIRSIFSAEESRVPAVTAKVTRADGTAESEGAYCTHM